MDGNSSVAKAFRSLGQRHRFINGRVNWLDLADEIQADVCWGRWKSVPLNFKLRSLQGKQLGDTEDPGNEANRAEDREDGWRQNYLWWMVLPELSRVSQINVLRLKAVSTIFLLLAPNLTPLAKSSSLLASTVICTSMKNRFCNVSMLRKTTTKRRALWAHIRSLRTPRANLPEL